MKVLTWEKREREFVTVTGDSESQVVNMILISGKVTDIESNNRGRYFVNVLSKVSRKISMITTRVDT